MKMTNIFLQSTLSMSLTLSILLFMGSLQVALHFTVRFCSSKVSSEGKTDLIPGQNVYRQRTERLKATGTTPKPFRPMEAQCRDLRAREIRVGSSTKNQNITVITSTK